MRKYVKRRFMRARARFNRSAGAKDYVKRLAEVQRIWDGMTREEQRLMSPFYETGGNNHWDRTSIVLLGLEIGYY